MAETNNNLSIPDAVNCSDVDDFILNLNNALMNPKISWKAKGLLVLLLNKSEWKVSDPDTPFLSTVTDMGKDGETAVISGIQELEKFGYLRRVRYRDADTKKWLGSF